MAIIMEYTSREGKNIRFISHRNLGDFFYVAFCKAGWDNRLNIKAYDDSVEHNSRVEPFIIWSDITKWGYADKDSKPWESNGMYNFAILYFSMVLSDRVKSGYIVTIGKLEYEEYQRLKRDYENNKGQHTKASS